MKLLKLVPDNTAFDFIGKRVLAFAMSGFLIIASLGLFFTQGLNLGIDFLGGILIEIKTTGPADLGSLRTKLSNLNLGDVTLQEFGASDDVLIRIQKQDGGDKGQQAAIDAVKAALGDSVAEYRRTEFVGPTVGAELREAATWAVLAAIGAILVYVWFRFEWQFGLGAVIALVHDVITTVGLFSLIQLEFNLATVAAVLTIAGYSINDTVVVYDRVRENMRRYKKMPLAELFNNSLNQTLSRTTMTSVTTLLALGALYIFGGEVIRGFSIALIWGVLIGTYSSIWLAVPFLLYVRPDRGAEDTRGELDEAQAS
ncbi:MAG: protein translocase subunit SecF [Rhodospirillaceae bacterium]|nr:protein translocase subunit SecF [Rhodospirillaceae bacterium]MBT5810439.1 protein translocase subunit SecF [Rhodospirillaceae bacterium]